MTYHPGTRLASVEPFVSPITRSGKAAFSALTGASSAVSATYPAVQRAHYFAIVIRASCTIYRFFWLNGATASTNNIQVGIYNDNDAGTDGPGTAVLRGTSTLATGANICQFDNVADTPIYPGRYWLAIWGSGTTTTLFRFAPSAVNARAKSGYLESGLAGGLPTTATPAQQTAPYIPVFGFTTIASP